MIKISVVIPVYNGEPYLRQCLDSVCSQTLKEIEIICVDDVSTDSSWQILEEYQQADSRFRLIRHEQNQGVSAGRNSGLSEAQGEYLIFWDCDDFFEPNALELLYQKAKNTNADICVCGADRYFNDKGKLFPFAYLKPKLLPKGVEVFNRQTHPENILNFANVAVWNKLFRKAFLDECELTFPPFAFGEDIYFTMAALCQAERITAIENILVHYRINNPNSLEGQTVKDPRVYFYPRIAVADYLREKGILPEQSFSRRSIGTISYVLRWGNTKQAFADTVRFLREDGVLEKLCIRENDLENFTPRQINYLHHLLHDELDELAIFVVHDTYMELRENAAAKGEAKAAKKKLKKQLAQNKEAFESALAKLSNEKEELTQINQQLKNAQDALNDENQQLKNLQDALNDENQQLKNLQETLSDENQRQAMTLEHLNGENQQQQAELSELSEMNSQLKATLEALNAEKTLLQKDLKKLTVENKSKKTELDKQIKKIAQFEEKQKILTDENQRLERECAILSAQLNDLKPRLSLERKRSKKAQEKLEKVLNSRTFRVGQFILYIPHKMLIFFRKCKQGNHKNDD